jgi:hypothetical protein
MQAEWIATSDSEKNHPDSLHFMEECAKSRVLAKVKVMKNNLGIFEIVL